MADATPQDVNVMADIELLPWWVVLLWGILSLIVGIMFFTTPGITTVVFITFLGAFWLVGGLFNIIAVAFDKEKSGWKIFLAILYIIAGILILAYPMYSALFALSIFTIFIGVWACFAGGVHLYQAFAGKDLVSCVLGLLSLLFGILILCFPFISAALVPFVAGAFAVVFGIIAIVGSFMWKKKAAPAKAA